MTKQDSFYDLYQEQLRVSANLSKQLKEALTFQDIIPDGMRKGDVISLINNNKQLRENNKCYQKVNQELKQSNKDIKENTLQYKEQLNNPLDKAPITLTTLSQFDSKRTNTTGGLYDTPTFKEYFYDYIQLNIEIIEGSIEDYTEGKVNQSELSHKVKEAIDKYSYEDKQTILLSLDVIHFNTLHEALLDTPIDYTAEVLLEVLGYNKPTPWTANPKHDPINAVHSSSEGLLSSTLPNTLEVAKKGLGSKSSPVDDIIEELPNVEGDTPLKELGIQLTLILDIGYDPDKILDVQTVINRIPTRDVPRLLLGYISTTSYDNLKATLLPLDPPFELSLDKLIKAVKEYKASCN